MPKSVTPLFFQPQSEGFNAYRRMSIWHPKRVYRFCFPKYLFKSLIYTNPQYEISGWSTVRLVWQTECQSTCSKGNNIKCQKKTPYRSHISNILPCLWSKIYSMTAKQFKIIRQFNDYGLRGKCLNFIYYITLTINNNYHFCFGCILQRFTKASSVKGQQTAMGRSTIPI